MTASPYSEAFAAIHAVAQSAETPAHVQEVLKKAAETLTGLAADPEDLSFTFTVAHDCEEHTIRTVEGNEIIVSYIVHDSTPCDFEWGDLNFKQFRDLDTRDAFRREWENEGFLVFTVDRYDHGSVHFSLSGEGPNCRWDTTRGCCLIAIPKDYAEGSPGYDFHPKEIARAWLDEYTNWCNGNVYGRVCERFDRWTGESIDHDSCWGYIGDPEKSGLLDALKDEHGL